MAAQVFWAVFYSSQWPSQIGPTADFDNAAISPTIFSTHKIFKKAQEIVVHQLLPLL